MAERSSDIIGIGNRRILEGHQVILAQWNAFMRLSEQLNKTSGFFLARRILLDGKRVPGFIQVGPVDRSIHHS
ncbi:hypothetical protein D3C72_1863250 [compost metagenome]